MGQTIDNEIVSYINKIRKLLFRMIIANEFSRFRIFVNNKMNRNRMNTTMRTVSETNSNVRRNLLLLPSTQRAHSVWLVTAPFHYIFAHNQFGVRMVCERQTLCELIYFSSPNRVEMWCQAIMWPKKYVCGWIPPAYVATNASPPDLNFAVVIEKTDKWNHVAAASRLHNFTANLR